MASKGGEGVPPAQVPPQRRPGQIGDRQDSRRLGDFLVVPFGRTVLALVVASLAILFLAYYLGSSPLNHHAGRGLLDEAPGLLDATTEQIITGLENGRFTSVELVQTYIARIREVNATLRAVVEINPDAVSAAADLDKERANGIIRGPLHGLPYLIKNNIATHDRMHTTAGSYALLGARVPRDAGVVAKLRAAGVIILGKTNLSQWANFRSNNRTSSNGWSALGGQVIGPYHHNQDPSGSSSGSGVASAIGLAIASLGTETDGSILRPSEANNIVGIKPTVGLTSRSLVIPISQHQDTVGPMARNVKDAAYLLQAIAGGDIHDNYTSAIPFDNIPDYVQQCVHTSLNGARIGIPRNMMLESGNDTVVLAAFERAIATLRTAGAKIFDDANVTDAAAADLYNTTMYWKVVMADFKSDLANLYLSHLTINPNNITSLETLREYTQNNRLEGYPERNTGIWERTLSQGFGNEDPRFWPLYQRNLQLAGPQGVLGILENSTLDALVLPTRDASSLSARIGSPVVTVPMGHYPPRHRIVRSTHGLVEAGPNIPFGLSFLGPRWSEAKLISLAYAFEQRTLARHEIKPRIVPKTEIRNSRLA